MTDRSDGTSMAGAFRQDGPGHEAMEHDTVKHDTVDHDIAPDGTTGTGARTSGGRRPGLGPETASSDALLAGWAPDEELPDTDLWTRGGSSGAAAWDAGRARSTGSESSSSGGSTGARATSGRSRDGRGRGSNPASAHSRDDTSHEDRPRNGRYQGGRYRGGRSRDAAEDRVETPEQAAARAREICLNQLGRSARTRAQLAEALRRRGIPDDIAEQVLDRFTEIELIDDAGYAEMFVRSRHRDRGLARRALAYELRRRGVDDEVAGEALAAVDEDDESETARRLVAGKLSSTRGLDPQRRVRRLVGMLARKGYGPGVALSAVKDALAQEADEEAHLVADEAAASWSDGTGEDGLDAITSARRFAVDLDGTPDI